MNLRDVADELNIRTESSSGNKVRAYCPVHDENSPDLVAYDGWDNFCCFSGGQEGGGSPVTLVMHAQQCGKEEAVTWLQEHFPGEFTEKTAEEIERRSAALDVLWDATALACETLEEDRKDLHQQIQEQRSFSADLIDDVEIGFLSEDDVQVLREDYDQQALLDSGLFGKTDDGDLFCHLTDRITFPYTQGRQVYFMIGRKLPGSNSSAKYKKTRATDYNRHILLEYQGDKASDGIIITEGVTDAISVYNSGYTVVSPVTTQFREKDVEKLVQKAKSYDTVYIAMDRDQGGQEGAEKTAEELMKHEVDSYLVQLPDDEDLDDWTTEHGYDINPLLDDAKRYTDMLIERVKDAEDADDYASQADATEHVLELIADWSTARQAPLLKKLPGSKTEHKKTLQQLTGHTSGKSKEKQSKTERVIELAEERAEFFSDQFDDGYAAVDVDDHREILKISSSRFKTWVSHLFWKEDDATLSDTALKTVITNLEGRALFDGDENRLHNRVAKHDHAFWCDLTNEDWQAVRIDKSGWTVMDEPPVLFRRYSHQEPQVIPEDVDDPATVIDEVFDFLNPSLDDDQRLLFKVDLIASLLPHIPHVVLVPYGSQGSLKSTLCKVKRRLVDPSAVELLSLPRSKDDLAQQLMHHWAPQYDNISYLKQWHSDMFCRTCTGEGFSKRRLYTDAEDVIWQFKRTVSLNGINEVPQAPDLLDRSLLMELERIPREERKTEEEVWSAFEDARPRIFGAMLDILSDAMTTVKDVSLDATPRMADYVRWGEAIARAMDYSDGAYVSAYFRNVEEQVQEALQAHPLGPPTLALMEDQDVWRGRASDLLVCVVERIDGKR